MEQDKGKGAKEPCAGSSLTRRSLFEIAGRAIAAAALPPDLAFARAPPLDPGAAQETTSVMERLSRYMIEARSRALPDDVVDDTKQHVLDTLAAIMSDSRFPPRLNGLE